MGSGGRYGPGQRAIAVILRTAHIAAMAMFVGVLWFAAPDAPLRLWQSAAVATGLALLATEVTHSRHWVYQGRGLMTLAHVGVLSVLFFSPELGRSAAVAALAIGSLGSHLPRGVRKWSLRHGRVVE